MKLLCSMKVLQRLIEIIQKRIRPAPLPVGRWRIEHCNVRMNRKIDLSNEDHCGPCGFSGQQLHKMK